MKYTASYIIPILAIVGLLLGSWWVWAAPVFAFILTPIIDAFFKPDMKPSIQSENGEIPKIYDWMLYLNLIWVYGCLFFGLYTWTSQSLQTYEVVGQVASVGLVFGTNGINVAHELGHRFNKLDVFLAELLLLPSFYMHFQVEHNRGHHLRVATPEDPATSRKNEWVYVFWFRSTLFSYISAWKIQLQMNRGKFFQKDNKMLRYTLMQLTYVGLLFLFTAWDVALLAMAAGVVGFLLLETVNYIEHYGLLRKKNEKGRYEPVQLHHSWNANYPFGRILLYDLTRHSDHHYNALKKYPTLENKNEAPNLPFGYPAAMLISFFPPLWFSIMNPKLNRN